MHTIINSVETSKNSPKISVVIPCYNIEKHLSKCIESVLAQTFSDFELLLIDDGSSDSTLEICKEYQQKDTRVKFFSHQNKGVSDTRNRGIDLAQGECIMFIDGDDFIKDDYFEYFINYYSKEIWAICGFTNIREKKKTENRYFFELLKLFPNGKVERADFLKLLEYYSLSSPCARIYDRKIIIDENIRFNQYITYQEDLAFNLRYLNHVKEIQLLDYFGYFYIEHKNSSTSRFHKNFDHIELLFDNLNPMVISDDDKMIVKEFIFQSVLRKISNIFHPKSNKNSSEKKNELSSLFNSKYFIYIYDYINKTQINFILKTILKLKSTFLIVVYYNLKRH